MSVETDAPHVTDEPSDFAPPPMHQASDGLHTAGLLTLILDPELNTSLSPAAILAADNLALFHLLPLILSAVQRIGETTTDRASFLKLVSVLRRRVVACRGLKLRFLLLVQNPAFAEHWDVHQVHRRHCYAAARNAPLDLSVLGDDAASAKSQEALVRAATSTGPESLDRTLLKNWAKDKSKVMKFAGSQLLHPKHGIHTRTIVYHMRPVRSAFYGTELVDGIMERANFQERHEALLFAQELLNLSVITRVASHSKVFKDERRSVYQCQFSMLREDDNHCSVDNCKDKPAEEDLKECIAKQTSTKGISQIEVKIPMDMIDLQSLEFWTHSVYIRNVEKGFRYGYRAITHPLYCAGVDPSVNIDFSKMDPKELAKQNGSSAELDLDSLEHAPSGAGSSSASVGTDEINDIQMESAVVGSVVVRKVFSSIARPMIIQLRIPLENADLEEDDHHVVLPPGLLVKEGDNLMQDLGVEVMFQVFNHIWAHTPSLQEKYGFVPMSVSYEVFPTSSTQGFMEAVTGLTSLKEYDWKHWRDKHGKDQGKVNEMLRSTVGSYVGAYLVGGRDRHFDNVLIKDDTHLLHIDFGFLLGTSPPIDGPPIAIAPQMEAVFRELKIWDTFVDLFVDTFLAIRARAAVVVRTSVMIFTKAGYEEDQVRQFLHGKGSLNVHETDRRAADIVRRQLVLSSGDIKTKFKQFSHEHIDPAWYGLLEKGFPPAVAIMKLVDAKEQRAARKLTQSKEKAKVADNEKVYVE